VNAVLASPQFLIAFGLLAIVAVAFVALPLVGRGAAARRQVRRQRALDELRDVLDPKEYSDRLTALKAEQPSGSDAPAPRGLVVTLLALVPALALLLYFRVGTPEGIRPPAGETAQVREFLGELTSAVKNNPEDIEAWGRLGDVWKRMEQFPAAESAFRRVLFIDPGNPDASVELAETLLFQSQRRRMPEESRALLRDVLAENPDHQKALWLAGMGAFQDGQTERAIALWTRLEAKLPEGSPVRASVSRQIAQANGQVPAEPALPANHPPIAGSNPPAAPRSVDPPVSSVTPDRNPAPAPSSQGQSINVEVSVATALRQRLQGNETVFVFARAVNGPPAPLAVKRFTAAELPATVTLSEADSMAQGLSIATFPRVQIVARISRTGNVMAAPGDLEGGSGPLTVNETSSVDVKIDRVIPAENRSNP